MRTVIFLAAIMIARPLRNLTDMPCETDSILMFYSVILCGAIFMDLVEFFKKYNK